MTAAASTPKTVHQAMAAVMKAVGPVAKDLKNEKAGYAARSIDGVMDALHDPMAEAGVFVVPEVESAEYAVVEVGKNKTPMRQATLRVRWRFYGPAGDCVEAVTYGEALDSGDKATNKAQSAALKYALLQTFLVPVTGDDADADHHERSGTERPEPKPPDAGKLAAVENLYDALPEGSTTKSKAELVAFAAKSDANADATIAKLQSVLDQVDAAQREGATS